MVAALVLADLDRTTLAGARRRIPACCGALGLGLTCLLGLLMARDPVWATGGGRDMGIGARTPARALENRALRPCFDGLCLYPWPSRWLARRLVTLAPALRPVTGLRPVSLSLSPALAIISLRLPLLEVRELRVRALSPDPVPAPVPACVALGASIRRVEYPVCLCRVPLTGTVG